MDNVQSHFTGPAVLPELIAAGKLTRTRFKLVSVTTADSPLLPADPSRVAVLVGAPLGQADAYVDKSSIAAAVSTAITGVKDSYTVPAGKTARFTGATAGPVGAGVTLQLQLVRAASTLVLDSITAAKVENFTLELQAADTIQWNCTVAVAATSCDLTLGIQEFQGFERVTLSFGQAPAVLDSGVNVYQQESPVLLWIAQVGEIVRNEIRAVMALATATIAVVEVLMVSDG